MEFVGTVGKIYEEIMKLRKDSDYVVNQGQMEKFLNIIAFFKDYEGAEVEPIDFKPREEHGGVTATFVVFDIFGDQIKRFCDVMQYASAISIDANLDCKVCISVTVANVFVEKTHGN